MESKHNNEVFKSQKKRPREGQKRTTKQPEYNKIALTT